MSGLCGSFVVDVVLVEVEVVDSIDEKVEDEEDELVDEAMVGKDELMAVTVVELVDDETAGVKVSDGDVAGTELGTMAELLEMTLLEDPILDATRLEATLLEATLLEATLLEAVLLEAALLEAALLEAALLEAALLEAALLEATLLNTTLLVEPNALFL